MTYIEAVYQFDTNEKVFGFNEAMACARRVCKKNSKFTPSFIVSMALDRMRMDCKTIQGYSCVVIDGVTFKHEIRGD
jgi:hypothetical protein